MQIQPYLFYDGRCDEAIEFYRAAVGAEVTMLMRFKDSPEPASHGNAEKVMHASLRIGDTTVLMSDGRCTGQLSFQGFRAVAAGFGRCRGRTVVRGLGQRRSGADAFDKNVLHLEIRHGRRPFRRVLDDLCHTKMIGA